MSRRKAKERRRAQGEVPIVWLIALAIAVTEARVLRERQKRWGRPPKRLVKERTEMKKREATLL